MKSIQFLILSVISVSSAFAAQTANEALANHPGAFQERIEREQAEKEAMRLEAEMLFQEKEAKEAVEREAYRTKKHLERKEGKAKAKIWAREFIDKVIAQLTDSDSKAAKRFLQKIEDEGAGPYTLAYSNTNVDFQSHVPDTAFNSNYFMNDEFRLNSQEYSHTFEEGPFKDWSIKTGNNNDDMFCAYFTASCFRIELVAPKLFTGKLTSSFMRGLEFYLTGGGFYVFSAAVGGVAGYFALFNPTRTGGRPVAHR